MSIRELVAKNIRRARKMRKISRENLSSLANIPYERLKRFENAEEFQDSSSMKKISDSLNIGIDFFYESSEGETEQKILLKRSGMPKSEKEAIFELARYKSKSAADLAIVLGLNIFRAPPKFDKELNSKQAKEIGKILASKWMTTGDTLSLIMESNGVFLIKIPDDNILFRGLFILRKNVPVIAVYEKERKDGRIIENISHELGHAVFLRQELDEDKEESMCDFFGEGFSGVIKSNGIKLGEIDFVQRMSLKAWTEEKITGSRAAEILGISTAEFFERYRNEANL